MKEQELTRFAESRNAYFLMLCMMVLATMAAFYWGRIDMIPGSDGFGLPSANEWISDSTLSFYLGIVLCIVQSLLLIYINRRFNLLRSVSPLFAGMFLIMQGAEPAISGQVYDGSILCLVVLVAIIPLFSTFQLPDRTNLIYLIFCLLAAGSMTNYSYIAYMATFFLGCFQMQCLSFRGILAMILGMITPLWILTGFGVIDLTELKLPVLVSVFEAMDRPELVQTLVYAIVTLLIGIVFGAWNLIRIYNYNSRTRAYNGFWTLLSLTTVALLLLDYYHWFIYLPMLNCCTAVQIGHFFAINKLKRGYFIVVCIILVYLALYIWGSIV